MSSAMVMLDRYIEEEDRKNATTVRYPLRDAKSNQSTRKQTIDLHRSTYSKPSEGDGLELKQASTASDLERFMDKLKHDCIRRKHHRQALDSYSFTSTENLHTTMSEVHRRHSFLLRFQSLKLETLNTISYPRDTSSQDTGNRHDQKMQRGITESLKSSDPNPQTRSSPIQMLACESLDSFYLHEDCKSAT
jgi:hypothetical protein